MVHDVNATIEYYLNILGFTFAMGVDRQKNTKLLYNQETIYNFAIVRKNDVEIMLQVQHSLFDEVPEFKDRSLGGTFTLYITMTDTKSFYNKIKDDVEIVKHLHKTFYGAYEFAIKDLNGYILYFAQQTSDE